ncbi:MAG: aspartate kinase [Clostridiales bacterium]|nr:aspartate kinase [Clostridiales bacterium]
MSIKIAKFGGSSLATAEQFKKVAAIVKADPNIRYVVPSAPGKAPEFSKKVTDMLYACADAYNTPKCDEIFDEIEERYYAIINGLGLNLDFAPHLETVRKNIKAGYGEHYAASRGEYLNGIILAAYLGFDFIDPADCIAFDENGVLDEALTHAQTKAILVASEYGVVPGFYGSNAKGEIRTFSRGGSDITGAIVARAAAADVYENWTDVSGCLMADPRIVDDPKPISYVTYSELRELAYMGASVLHDEAIFPVRIAGIPINIRNTNDPSHPGTMIIKNLPAKAYERPVTGIAGRKGFTSIQMERSKMNNEVGFARRALQVLEEENISLEHMPTGIDTLSVIVANSQIEGKLPRVLKKLQLACQPDSMEVSHDMALIATVGHGMSRRVGISAALFTALANAGVNVRMIDQGSSELNIIVGVANEDFEVALRAIYAKLVAEGQA